MLLVEVESELGLIVEVFELGNVEGLCVLCVELGRDIVGGVVEFFEKFWLNTLLAKNNMRATKKNILQW